jgi:hypothetical protein
MNRYLDLCDLTVDVNKSIGYNILVSYPCKFTDMSSVDVRLSAVMSNLIDKKIIDMDQLNILIKLKYVESFLYLEEKNCFHELMRIKPLKMTPELFNQIRAEYKKVDSENFSHEHIAVDLDALRSKF